MTLRTPTDTRSRAPLPTLLDVSGSPSVGGYRLRELLAIGESANVYEGVLDIGARGSQGSGSEPGSVAVSMPVSEDAVAVKVCLTPPEGAGGQPRLGADRARSPLGRTAECRALEVRPIAAMPRLLDLSTTERGELVVVMTLCRGRPLLGMPLRSSAVAASFESLQQLVHELHDAGVAHGGLDPGAVLVDDDGSLSLVGFRAASFAGDPGFESAVGADLRAVATLARRLSTSGAISGAPLSVMGRASPRSSPDVSDGRADLGSGGGLGDSADAGSGRGERVEASGDLDDGWRWSNDETVDEPMGELTFLDTLEPAVLAIRETGVALRHLVARRPGGRIGSRRRRALAAGGAVVVAATVVGCLLIPSGGPGTAEAEGTMAPSSGPLSTASDSRDSAEHPLVSNTAEEAIRSDDPVRAASALLEIRRACLRAGDPTCLDAVDQWNAPAVLDDRELARGSDPLADPLASVSTVSLVERVGASALLRAEVESGADTKKPVSLLVMRGETGWRLRSYRVDAGVG